MRHPSLSIVAAEIRTETGELVAACIARMTGASESQTLAKLLARLNGFPKLRCWWLSACWVSVAILKEEFAATMPL